MILLIPLIGFILLFSLLPFIWSIFTVNDFSFPEFIAIIKDSSMRISMEVSLLYSIITIALSLGISMQFAVRLFHLKPKTQNLFLILLFLTWMIPGFISVPIYRSVLYWFCDSLVDNTFFAFFITAVIRIWMNIPITTLIAFASIKNISQSQVEMMRIQGANKEQCDDYLFKPLTKEILLSFSVILLINSLRELSVPLMLTNGRPFVIDGFTPYGIAGSTTTWGLFLKEAIYRTGNDFIGYSQSLIVTAFILLLFFSIKRVRKGYYGILLCVPLLDLFFYANPTAIMAMFIFYLFYMKYRSRFGILIIPFIFTSLVLHECTPGFLMIFLLLLFKEKKLLVIRPIHWLWKRICDFSILFWLFLTLLIFFMFIKLVFSDPLYIPDWNEFSAFTFANFEALFSDHFQLNVFNSTSIGVFSALLTILVVFPAAYYATLHSVAYKKLNTLIIFSMVMTGMNTIVPLFFIFKLTGLINSLLGVILIIVNHALPMAFFIAFEDMRQIPHTFIDQARIEGAGPIRTFIKIIFPQILPISLVVFAKVMIDGWASFTAPLIFITDQNKYPVSLRLYTYAGKDAMMYPQWGKFAAGSLISLIVLFALVFPLRTVFFKGVYRSWTEEQL